MRKVSYKAWDRHLETHVALKIPHVEGMGPERREQILARFHREAKAAARLPPHSNICAIRDHGEIDGQPYVTMAFLNGRPLSRVRKPQPIPTAIRTVRRIARAMQVAHDHAVIHRDLKPDNIMIVDNDQPVVMDFGLARRMDSEESLQTVDGTVIGTPAYMSPEQVGGKQAEIGPQSDVYSLGVICYELLTGHRPFEAESVMGLLTKIATETPAPPSRLNPGIDAELDEICLRVLSRDREMRYASMLELDEALADYSAASRGRKRRASSKLLRESVRAHPQPTADLTPAEMFPELAETEIDPEIESLKFATIVEEQPDPRINTETNHSTRGTERIVFNLDQEHGETKRPRDSPWLDPKLMGAILLCLSLGGIFIAKLMPPETPAKTTPDDPSPKPAIPIDAQPPEDKQPAEEVAVNKIAVPETEEPATKPAELPEQTEPALAETPEAKTPEQTEPVLPPPAVEVVYTTKEANTVTKGMLLRHDAAQQEWGTLPYRTKVILGEQLACPEPLDAVFSISKTDCEVTFIGGVLASFQPLKSPEAFSLNLSQGKVLFTRPDSDSEEPSVLCSVIVEDDVLQLELSTNARCGLEILPRFPNQFEKSLGPHWYTGRLWVDSGQVRFTDRTGNKYLLAAKQALDISPDQSSETPPTVEADLIMPDWLNPLSRTFTSQTARYMRQIHGAFEAADVESDVTLVLLPLAKNDKTPPAVAVMAAKTLAMTGCVRDVADLLSLNEASPEELRLAAIEGTRRWLTLHPDKEHGQSLRDALGRNFQKDTASAIYRLLWGYRKSDLKNGSEGLKLVDQLMDRNITVRTLAFLHLYELTYKTNNYRPLDPESQRRSAVSRWREDVSGGKIFGSIAISG